LRCCGSIVFFVILLSPSHSGSSMYSLPPSMGSSAGSQSTAPSRTHAPSTPTQWMPGMPLVVFSHMHIHAGDGEEG
jgi:hypothetical protein